MNAKKWRCLWVAGAWVATSLIQAQAQTVVVQQQNFNDAAVESQIGNTPPAGWTVKTFYSDGSAGDVKVTSGPAEWLGWKFVTPNTWTTKKTTAGNRGEFTKASGGIALIESDGLRADKNYNSSLIAPKVAVSASNSYVLTFDTHYRKGQPPQSADVTVTFDKGAAVTRPFTVDTLNTLSTVEFTPPAGATTAQVSWNYANTSNNWYWAVDNYLLKSSVVAPPKPFDPSKLPDTASKPSLLVGPTLQSPGADRMTVMLETNEPSPTVWMRKAGSTGAFTIVDAANATGAFADVSIFFADLKGLESNTLYEYAVVTGNSNAPKLAGPYHFKTWPKAGDDVAQAKFVVIADSQDGRSINGMKVMQRIAENGVMQKDCDINNPQTCASNVAGFILAGDFTNWADDRPRWNEQVFGPLAKLLAHVPLIPSAGNHEYDGSLAIKLEESDKWAINYRKYFARLPSNGSTKHPLHWYSLDYQGLRIISTDSTSSGAMHNGTGWSNYDSGRGLFHPSYMKEQLDWFVKQMDDADRTSKSHVVLINHQPCLSTIWRQSEVMASCDLMAQLEKFSKDKNRIAAAFNGHVHSYERGHSMDSRTLWINAASASGGLEDMRGQDNSRLDVFVNARNDFGYGVMTVDFGNQPKVSWKRYSMDSTTGAFPATDVDGIVISTDGNSSKPSLPTPKLGAVSPATVKLNFAVPAADKAKLYEAQWQLSKTSKFDSSQPVYDVWGGDTRRENWTHVNGVRVDTQKGADISTLELGNMLANPRRVFPNVDANSKRGKLKTAIVAGGNSLLDRWSCAYKWDDVGDVGETRQGGRQCFARLVQPDGTKGSAFDPFNGKEPAVLQFGNDERWYWRVRVRDENLNWSEWSDAGSFELGNPAPEPEVERVLIDKQLPTSGLPTVGLNVKAFASCESVSSGAAAAPADLLPRTLKAESALISFQLQNCSKPGFEAKVQLSLPAAPAAGSKLMKVSTDASGKKTITEITSAVLTGATISYSVTDGGALDEDGKQNASIIDPVILASPVTVPPEPATVLTSQLVSPGAGLPKVGLDVKSLATCQQTNASAAPVPADLLPRTLQAATGLISFNLANCSAAGLEALVQLTLPSAPPAGSKVLKVSKGANGKWVTTEITDASISGNTVSYRVIDGGPLDEDGKVNAAIVDPVMVASPAAVPPPPVNTTPVPVNNPLALMLVAMLMAGAAFWQQRRSR